MKLQFKKEDISRYIVLLNNEVIYTIEKYDYSLSYSDINYHYEVRHILSDKINKFTYLRDAKKFITNEVIKGNLHE